MKKLIASFASAFSALLTFTPLAFATHVAGHIDPPSRNIIDCGNGQFTPLCNLSGEKFGSYLSQIITFTFVAAIIIALAFLIYGGIKWITSGGEKGGVEEARNHIIAAVVGLIIVFLSYFILSLVVYFFTGTALTNITIPSLNTR